MRINRDGTTEDCLTVTTINHLKNNHDLFLLFFWMADVSNKKTKQVFKAKGVIYFL